jgi:hypothetical protein
MYNLNTRQSSKVYLSKLLEVKSFLCFSVFLAFAQCIGLLEVRGFQVIVLFQLKLRKWKWIPSTYEWTLHPYIRHFVRWAVSPFLHPPTHPQTYPSKWYALHRSLSIATSRRLWWTGHVVRLGCHRHADTKLICEIISETDSWNTKKKKIRWGKNEIVLWKHRENGSSIKLAQDGVRWRVRSLVVFKLGVCYQRVSYIQQQSKLNNNNNNKHDHHEELNFGFTEAFSSWT